MLRFLSLFCCYLLLMPVSFAAVYPVPQRVERWAERVQVREVQTELRTPESKGGLWNLLPRAEGGYVFCVSADGRLHVCAQDEAGLFYAKQTLCQLLQGVPGAAAAHADPFPQDDISSLVARGTLPLGVVADWPDVPCRGVVEGYYGIPWSMESRRSVLRFMGRNKMNFYLYAPKDDPYHHGSGCYEPYPEDKARELAELVRCARENHVRFVWAIHPSDTVRWAEEGGRVQLEGLCAKLQAMYDLGVREFAVLVDDTTGEIGKVERQAELCNYLAEHFLVTHPEACQELLMCPTGYCRAWTPGEWLQRLGALLRPDIRVMWTGDRVVSDITREGQQWVAEQLGRPTFIWWNRPCNDMKASRLQMGRIYGLDQSPEMAGLMSGFAANPMEHAEGSKVGLFSVADYTWNRAGFDSEKSWRSGMQRLYPAEAAAFACFCEHNSRLMAWDDGPTREESVCLDGVAPRFWESLAAAEPDAGAVARLHAEFARAEQAGAALCGAEGEEMRRLQAEMGAWFDSFARTGRAGRLLTEAIMGQRPAAEALQDAEEELHAMSRAQRFVWRDGKPEPLADVQPCSAVLTPAMQAAMRYVQALVQQQQGLPLRASLPAFADKNGVSWQGSAAVSSGSDEQCWHADAPAAAGDTLTLDLGTPTELHSVNLQMGCVHDRKAVAPEGVLSFSCDGETWETPGEPTAESCLMRDWSAAPLCARYVRYTVTKAGSLPLSVRNFCVNGTVPAMMETNIPGLTSLSAYERESGVGMERLYEEVRVPAGGFVRMIPSRPLLVKNFRLAVEDADAEHWVKLEFSLADDSVITPPFRVLRPGCLVVEGEHLPLPVKAVRLSNAGEAERPLLFYTFELYRRE